MCFIPLMHMLLTIKNPQARHLGILKDLTFEVMMRIHPFRFWAVNNMRYPLPLLIFIGQCSILIYRK